MDFVQENERESAAAAAAAGAAAGAAAASASRAGAGRRRPSRLSIYRVPRRPSTGKLNWGKGPFPENLWTEVVYSDQFQLTCTAGALQQYTFAMNGLYDPNLTGTGSQPRYFDTLCGANTTAAPYRAYVVKAARMKGDGLRPRSRFSGHPFSRCDFRHRRNIYRTFYGHGTDAAQRHELQATLLLRRWQADRHSLSDLRGGPDTWRQRHRRCLQGPKGLPGGLTPEVLRRKKPGKKRNSKSSFSE